MNDPTYDSSLIDANPVWKLAWVLSELDNDNAPIGWGNYIKIANSISCFKPDAVKYIVENKYV
jgi:hypothetical protein